MKAKVDESLCIGCELCVQICPGVFRMEGDFAVAIVDTVPPSMRRLPARPRVNARSRRLRFPEGISTGSMNTKNHDIRRISWHTMLISVPAPLI